MTSKKQFLTELAAQLKKQNRTLNDSFEPNILYIMDNKKRLCGRLDLIEAKNNKLVEGYYITARYLKKGDLSFMDYSNFNFNFKRTMKSIITLVKKYRFPFHVWN